MMSRSKAGDPRSPLLGRLAGFTLVQLLGTLAPLALLPVAARVGGIEGWYSLSVGQAIGTFGSIVISYGWNVLGPTLVATAESPRERQAHWAESLRERLVLAAIVVPVVAVISVFLASPGQGAFTLAMAVAFSLGGLTPNWYFIGVGTPAGIAWFDMVPKLVATLLTTLLILLTGSLWAYPALWIVASLAGLFAAHHSIGRPAVLKGAAVPVVLAGLRKRFGVAMVDGLGGVYVSAPVPIAGATGSVAGAAMLASADKLYRFGLISVSTLGNSLQAWALDPSAPNPRGRNVRAILAHLILGLVGMCGLGLLGEFATALLFDSQAAATTASVWFYGGAFFAVSCSTPLIRNLLIPAQKTRFVLAGTAAGAVLGVVTMFVLGALYGPNGIAAGFMISELVLLAIILPPALRQLNVLSHRGVSSGHGA